MPSRMRQLYLSIPVLLVVIGLPSFLPAQTAEKIRLTAEQAISMRRFNNPQWTPDGTKLAVEVTEPPRGSERQTHIWVYSVQTRELRQFTASAKSETHPRWSPDGQRLAFLSSRSDPQQIHVMPADGGEAKPLTEGKHAIENFEWSPDGKQIAFLAPDEKTDAEEKKEKDKDDARSVDGDAKRTHLWVADATSGKARLLAGAPWQFSELQWLPNSQALVVVATDHPESDQETNRIFSIGLSDGVMKLVTALPGPFGGVQVSPAGSEIAFVGSRVDGPQPHDLYVLPLSGGAPRNLTAKSIDRPVDHFKWRPDGTLIALVEQGFRNLFYRIDSNGRAEPLTAPGMSVNSFDASTAGTIAFTGGNASRLPELWMWDQKSLPQSVSHINEGMNKVALFTPEFVKYKSFDGREIEGALLRPANAKAKQPTILLIHGGPTGNWNDSYEPWGQMLVTAGYTVFYPNIRGSSGYGFDFEVLNRGDWGGGDFKDVMAAADYLVAQEIADPNRMGIAGWSYGGYMSEWAITQTNRFKAAVSGAGLSDLAAEFGTEDHPSYDEWFYGLPYEKPEGFRKSSPLTYVKNAHTPTLILQGEADVIDPLGQSQALYRALKRYGVTTELVVYPREGHSLHEEKHLEDRLNRIVAWFDKYLR